MQSNNINSEALLQQLVTLATSLQSSIVSLDAKANEIKDYQKSADTKIDLIRDEVFKAEAYGTHSRKMHDGHVSDALNEESNPTDDVDAKHDVDNLVNKSDLTKPDVGDDANNAKPDFGNDANNATAIWKKASMVTLFSAS